MILNKKIITHKSDPESFLIRNIISLWNAEKYKNTFTETMGLKHKT